MCFVNENYEWIARINEQEDIVATSPTKCDECYCLIPAGAFAHTIHMQESDGECVTCEQGDCECVGDCCQCAKPHFGETFDYVRCEECDKFLRSVEAAEVEEGCSSYEARPGLPMTDDIQGIGRKEAKRYWKKARTMFPELVASGYLGKHWRRMFGLNMRNG